MPLQYGKLARPRTYREDDWKKAYVTFVPPPWAVREQLEKQQGQQGEGEEAERGQEEEGVALASSQQPESPLTMLKMIRKVKLGRGKGGWGLACKGASRQWLALHALLQLVKHVHGSEPCQVACFIRSRRRP